MAIQVQVQARKTETPAQWNKALQRALNEALDVLTEAGSGATFVESSTMPGTLYRVTAHGCSCAAGARGIVCKHRACLLAQLGILPLDTEPEPDPEPTVRCGRCFGQGQCWHGTHDDGFRRGVCPWCGGSGRLTVPGYGVEEFPAVEPVIAA